MNPRIFVRFSRPRQLARLLRTGFTLVELLVVIAIIAMLAALLVPAVQRAREAGRRATCMNNQQQIGKAVINYVTAKDKFPPSFSLQPGTTYSVGWVPPLLPYLEENPFYQIFQANDWATLANASVATLICPSRNPTSGLAPLSYVVNCGMRDRMTPTAGQPMDYQANGIFFDAYWPTVNPAIPKTTVDLAFISKHDGNSKTLMLSENVDALDWITVMTATPGYPPGQSLDPSPDASLPPQLSQLSTHAPSQSGNSWWQGFVWYVSNAPSLSVPAPALPAPSTQTPTDASYGSGTNFPTGQVLNKSQGASPTSDQYYVNGHSNGRPSSTHPGGFLATMCDGHTQFISEEMEWRVYCLLMAPDSQNVIQDPNSLAPNNAFNYPRDWLIGPAFTGLIPFTDADLQ